MVVGAFGGLLAVVPVLFSPLRRVGRMSELPELEPEPQSPIASASSAPA
jgi:hypothetical protein